MPWHDKGAFPCLLPEGRFKGAPLSMLTASPANTPFRFTCKSLTNVPEMRDVKYLVL